VSIDVSRHPSIVRMHGWVWENDTVYLVMERADGRWVGAMASGTTLFPGADSTAFPLHFRCVCVVFQLCLVP
jgi:hypothetical protein